MAHEIKALHDALHRLTVSAWDGGKRSAFTIPPRDSDADVMLGNALAELERLRTFARKWTDGPCAAPARSDCPHCAAREALGMERG